MSFDRHTLFVVTGAPGSGKTAAAEAFIRLRTPYLAFDIDWLADSASELADRSIYFDSSTWKLYGALWFEVLHAVYRNGRTPVFFTPDDPGDFASHGLPDWCNGVEWLLLDCSDAVRLQRLQGREGWTERMIQEALGDASHLRESVPRRVDTERRPPEQVAKAVLVWLEEHHSLPARQ